MRVWLDEHRFEPSTFFCQDQSFGVLVSVEFRMAPEAKAFAQRFDGRMSNRLAAGADEGSVRDPGLSPYAVVGLPRRDGGAATPAEAAFSRFVRSGLSVIVVGEAQTGHRRRRCSRAGR
jgi:hypothetical protein